MYYLVYLILPNYLHYPEVENYKAQVRGFWKIDINDGLPENHSEQRVMLYVSDSDEEEDNVYATFEQESNSYKFGFAFGEEYKSLNGVELKFDEPIINSTEYNLMKTIQPDPTILKKTVRKRLSPHFISANLYINMVSIWIEKNALQHYVKMH